MQTCTTSMVVSFFDKLVWLSLCSVVLSHIVKTLPGYKGDLPFKLETGYVNVSVGKSDAVNLFYYFIESEGNPREDPLMLWLTGGPGCSGFSGLVYEIGPLNFDTENFDGNFPTYVLNPYCWTEVANIIERVIYMKIGPSWVMGRHGPQYEELSQKALKLVRS
ncbi:hypothetical protein CsSME_00009781 [Camellia sinensis var. sinensis]